MKKVKVVFMGTPAFSVPALTYLIENTEVVLVVSQPDREKNRKGELLPTPIKSLAISKNIPVYQPMNIKTEYAKVIEANPDIIITCAYGQIIPEALLTYPKYGCINIHGSLLPRLRGGAPIHHAIIDGDKETGITIMYMDKKMDAGDIISEEKIPILEDDTLDSLYEKMSVLGERLLAKTLPSIIDGTNKRIKQDESLVTFGLNIKKEEERIVFNLESTKIYNQIRGLSSIPGAYTMLDDKRLKVYNSKKTTIMSKKEPGTIEKIDKSGIYVSTKDYLICLTDIKLEGKKRCLVKDFINGINIDNYIGKVLE